ncbi:hypothetical protein P154DRAFT_609048 [Amniculicola lignicola CBS 123094]|uniref:Uncharacterized protein n=1 Tax=Amniculicola lignicola CBS 123094 TaxID=1392246 RepID=A0A6A5W365_9PLEO|nr:hypothetical protein P154DRAFT_609048 [Amniculicola lignicola CBS 123094]
MYVPSIKRRDDFKDHLRITLWPLTSKMLSACSLEIDQVSFQVAIDHFVTLSIKVDSSGQGKIVLGSNELVHCLMDAGGYQWYRDVRKKTKCTTSFRPGRDGGSPLIEPTRKAELPMRQGGGTIDRSSELESSRSTSDMMSTGPPRPPGTAETVLEQHQLLLFPLLDGSTSIPFQYKSRDGSIRVEIGVNVRIYVDVGSAFSPRFQSFKTHPV